MSRITRVLYSISNTGYLVFLTNRICFSSKMVYNMDMNFALIFKFLIENFTREKIDFALMGNFALQTIYNNALLANSKVKTK